MRKISTHDVMRSSFDWFHSISKAWQYGSILVISLILASADYLTGYELGFSFFYLLPVSVVTWFLSARLGVLSAIFYGFLWGFIDLKSGHEYSNIWFPIWNSLMRVGFYFVVAKLLNAVKTAFEKERLLSRTDFLTGVYNSRHMLVQIHRELERFKRYQTSVSLAYIDLDNFKTINDTLGHASGDEVLKTVSNILSENLRKTDIIGRMGGDEFVVLLAGTSLVQAKFKMQKLENELLKTMNTRNWPVTFSIGLVSPTSADVSTEKLIKSADDLMYQVKRSGKNAILAHAA